MDEVTEHKYVSWQIIPYFFPLLASAAISLAIALYTWRHMKHSERVALTFLMLTIAIWSIAYALELSTNELQLKLFFTDIEYIGITLLPVAWLALALEFSGHESWLSLKRLCLLVIMPVITMVLVWTNDYHNLIYKDAWVDFSQGYPALEIVRGQWYWVNVAYSYALVLIATLLVIEAFIHSTKLYRKQASVLLIGALIPWIANLAYMMGWHPFPYLDTTPLAFLFTGLAAAIGFFYFGLLDIMPVARNIIIENISEGIIVLDGNNRILDMNSAALKMTGLNLDQSIGKHAANLHSTLLEPIDNLIESSKGNVEAHMEREVLAERDNRYYNLSVSPIYGMRGDLKARILLIQDITDRKQAEDRMIASLHEKEVLLKEVHHRVKNNLQIISALLSLQSSYITDEDIIKIFRDSQNRIKSMALVHENLYRSKDLDKVDFNEYIKQLVSNLSQSYGDLAGKIDFKVNSENVFLNINTAIPCGMIINELVSNSLKHAFPDGRRGEVCIDLSSEDDGFRLVVSDNGIGIKGGLNIKESKTLGFRLIDTLVKQIDGKMSLDATNGTRCEIHFKGLK